MTVIPKTPASAAGVLPSAKVRALRTIGTSVSTTMDSLTQGTVVLLAAGAFVVLRTEHGLRCKGDRLVLRDVDGAALRTIRYEATGWVTKLELPSEVAEGEGLWTIQPGDIILYPGCAPERAVAAIRHPGGWMRTAAPWTPYSDAEVILHLREGRIRVLRSARHQAGTNPRKTYPVGSVVASRSRATAEPTVWLKTGDNYWVSNTRGTTASDVMVNYELKRRTYHVVHAPERTGA